MKTPQETGTDNYFLKMTIVAQELRARIEK
jgi:hypothetical protein